MQTTTTEMAAPRPRFACGDIVAHASTGNRGQVKAIHKAGPLWMYCVQPIDFPEDGIDGFDESELREFARAHDAPPLVFVCVAESLPQHQAQPQPQPPPQAQPPPLPCSGALDTTHDFDASSAAWRRNKLFLTDGMGGRIGVACLRTRTSTRANKHGCARK